MEIFVAHSTLVAPEGSWLLKQLTDYNADGVVPVYDLGGARDPISDELLLRSDAFVTEFSIPNEEQTRKVMLARGMGKSVLAFLPPHSSLTEYFPDLSRHEFKRDDNNCYITEKPGSTSLTVYRGGMRSMKLKIWVRSQLMRERIQTVTAEERRKIAEDWQTETAADAVVENKNDPNS